MASIDANSADQQPQATLDLTNPRALVMLDGRDKTEAVAAQIQRLVDGGYGITASEGTAKFLNSHGIAATVVEEITGYAPAMNHRMASNSWETSSGLISDQNDPSHDEYLQIQEIPKFQLLICTVYGLDEEMQNSDSTWKSRLEKTDFGGPAALRAAAKGRRVTVFDIAKLESTITRLLEGNVTPEWLDEMAAEAEFFCARYAGLSATNISGGDLQTISLRKVMDLRYGENPPQEASLWRREGVPSNPLAMHNFQIITPERVPSVINLTDIDGALAALNGLTAVCEINQLLEQSPSGVVVKHGSPVGIAVNDDPIEVIRQVFTGNPEAEFGGVAMFNFPINGKLARSVLYDFLSGDNKFRFLWGIIAPSFDEAARKRLSGKTVKKLLMENPALATLGLNTLSTLPEYIPLSHGDMIIQSGNRFLLDLSAEYLRSVGPDMSDQQRHDLLVAWAACAYTKSNSTTGARDGVLIGNGTGHVSRIDACRESVRQAGDRAKGAVFVTDNFFPDPDGLRIPLDAGASVVMATSTDNEKRNRELEEMAIAANCIYITVPEKIGRIFYGHKGG